MNFRCVAVAGLLLLFNTIQTHGQLEEYFKWKQITFVQSDNRFGLGKKPRIYLKRSRIGGFFFFKYLQFNLISIFLIDFKCCVYQ